MEQTRVRLATMNWCRVQNIQTCETDALGMRKSTKDALIYQKAFNFFPLGHPCFLQSSIKHTFVFFTYVQAKKIIVNSL